MTRDEVLTRLRAEQAELRRLGVESLSLFGSMARGSMHAESDIDLAARFRSEAKVDAFQFIFISERLKQMLGTSVDLVGEPARRPVIQAGIDKDRIRVF